MKIEFRTLHHYERLSRETPCFTANLYVAGESSRLTCRTGVMAAATLRLPVRPLLADARRYRGPLGLTETFVVDVKLRITLRGNLNF
tara:strand:+ start:21777 stop:22037 length:261 start_codon:yes stop_codon:yes gene_type:complete